MAVATYRHYALDHPALYSLSLSAPTEAQPEHMVLAAQVTARMKMILQPYNLSEAEAAHTIRLM